ncbi:MAG: hypothetical protein HYW79_04040 [Parcubacteria group bacterium]|nr:hypothetical protein [Parcubacteria group bacterium]
MKKEIIIKDILKYLVIGGAILLILSSPSGTRRFLKEIPKELKRYKRLKLRRALLYLKTQDRIQYIEKNNVIVAKITEKGKNYLKKFDFDNLSLIKPDVWDKKWRLVIFDIPERKKLAREALRQKLKDLGLIKLQDSIWVTPFPCEEEVILIKSAFNLSDFWLDVIITENVGNREYQLRKQFDLI